jgi:hypothetical protein
MRQLLTIVIIGGLSSNCLAVCKMVGVIHDNLPSATFNIRGDTYSGLEWQDGVVSKPTEKQVNDWMTACQIADAAKAQAAADATAIFKDSTKTVLERLNALATILDAKQIIK